MNNAYVNSFAALEPSTGRDGFSLRQGLRKPAAGIEARAAVNRLFRANLAMAPSVEALIGEDAKETAAFVVEQFLNRPTLA